jgi:MerR family redox-sensitive transcriptional activator SoxR
MQGFTIGEIAGQVGVATSTIRYYESIGLLPPAQRVNGRRRYDGAIVQKLGVIRLAQEAGFTIAEIHALLHDFPVNTPPSERWQTLATQKIVEMDALLTRVQAMKALLEQTLTCNCERLEDCASVEPTVQSAC